MTIKELVNKVRAQAEQWGEKLEPPASPLELKNFQEHARDLFGANFPQAYLNFLCEANGLEYNGLVFYGTKNSETYPNSSPLNLLEMNIVFRDSSKCEKLGLIVLGEDSTGILVFSIIENQFQYRDRIRVDRVTEYLNFENLLQDEIAKVI